MNAIVKAHRSSNGDNPTGLGRWTWTRLEGRYKYSLPIFRPIASVQINLGYQQLEANMYVISEIRILSSRIQGIKLTQTY